MSDVDIFKRQREKDSLGLIIDGKVISQDHTPTSIDDVVGREGEKETINDLMYDVIIRGNRSDLNIVGPSGLGKTYLVKAILSEVNKKYSDKFRASYVNCKEFNPPTKYKLHNAILAPWGQDLGKGFSDQDTERRLKSLAGQKPTIIILDEVDELTKAKGELFYSLFRSEVSLIMISNVPNWDEKLDSRVRSHAQASKTIFAPYSEEGLFNVFKYIREKGIKPGTMNDEILRMVAKQTKEEYLGDVRKGKNLIRQAIEKAQNDNMDVVTREHLEHAYGEVALRTLTQLLSTYEKKELIALASLVSVQKDLYARAGLEDPEPTAGNVYKMFKRNVQKNEGKLIGQTQMKNNLRRLEESKLIVKEIRFEKVRGQVGYYYLSEEYTVEDYYHALVENGVTPWTTITVAELFR